MTNITAFPIPTEILNPANYPEFVGQTGANLELQKTDTRIQWRLADQNPPDSWKNLVELEDLIGPEGDQGDEGPRGADVELRVSGGWIQWRRADQDPADDWEEIVALSTLVGPAGPQGAGFEIDATGLLEDLGDFDAEEEGFVYLATDTGNLYFRQGEAGNWSAPVPFVGPEGPEGPKGLKGDKGDKGDSGVGGLIHVGEDPPDDATYGPTWDTYFWLDIREEEEEPPV